MSVLRTVRKRKKVRKLGSVTIIRREAYADLELDAKVELIRSLIPLGLMHVQELLDQEVTALASERYARKDASVSGRRHGSNPGTVGLAGKFGGTRYDDYVAHFVDDGPIDILIVTHADDDHFFNLVGFVEDFEVGEFWNTGYTSKTLMKLKRWPRFLTNTIPALVNNGIVRDRAYEFHGDPGASSRPARRSCGRSRSGTCPVRTWWPCSWIGKTFADATHGHRAGQSR